MITVFEMANENEYRVEGKDISIKKTGVSNGKYDIEVWTVYGIDDTTYTFYRLKDAKSFVDSVLHNREEASI